MLLPYYTPNYYTYITSTNTRNQLAQRGHNKQGRHNLRQVGLSYVLDGESGLSLCHHVYPGNVADVEEFSVALARIVRLLDQNQIARDTVTLVFDKCTAALANSVQLQEAGWDGFLPCLLQLHGVVQCGRALVEDQRDRVASYLVLIQQTHDARQGYSELFDIGYVARVHVVA